MIRRAHIQMLVSAVQTLTYSSLCCAIVLLFPALLPKCSPSHPGWRPRMLSVFWLRKPYSLFSTGFLPRISEGGFFSGNFSLLYEACFSDNSTPPAGKDVFSIPGCPSELAQAFFSYRLKCSMKAMFGMYLRSRTTSLLSLIFLKKGNFLANGIHYVA